MEHTFGKKSNVGDTNRKRVISSAEMLRKNSQNLMFKMHKSIHT